MACRYTRGLGTLPGTAILEMIPQESAIAKTGTLSFTFGSNFVNLFRCRPDFATIQWSTTQGQTAIVKIWDRRWAWHVTDALGNHAGEILGRYNVRLVNGAIDQNTEKTPQQLATLLLQAMGEQTFDVSALPNDVRPYVDWDYAHPASELDALCELLGCRVALKIATDSVKIVRMGVGSALSTVDLFRVSQTGDLAEAPDSLKVVGGLARFQSKLKLQAVGKDNDGKIKPIDNLSYKPAGGWSGISWPFSVIANDTDRQLAQSTVWRWYQIVSQADGTQDVPDFMDVQDIENIKPIDDFLVDVYTDAAGNILPQEAFVEGIWFNSDGQAGVAAGANTSAGTRYEGEFSIQQDNGVVIFPEQVYKLDTASRVEAELYLTCSYHAREPVSQIFGRWIQFRDLGGQNGTGPLVIRRPDIVYTSRGIYTNEQLTGTDNNQTVVEPESLAQLDATQLEFAGSVAFDAGYNGIVPIDIDGLTRQVTFKVNKRDRGPRGGAETYVSVNSETDPYVPRYRQRRSIQRARAPRTGLTRVQRFPRP